MRLDVHLHSFLLDMYLGYVPRLSDTCVLTLRRYCQSSKVVVPIYTPISREWQFSELFCILSNTCYYY